MWRSNQLNFTKIRATKEELQNTFAEDSVKCGYVTVKDKFGDYGLVGFYALRENRLEHFCFSCRTLGMGIEQYVYHKLQCPQLNIVGEVVSDLNGSFPRWINQDVGKNVEKRAEVQLGEEHSVLIKGPCDLFQVLPYIADKKLIDTEFTFVNKNGITIESTGHTTHVVEAFRLNEAEKQKVISEVPFADYAIYSDAIYKKRYKVVIISILSDANLGVYRRKQTGERIAFLEGFHPLTDPSNWEAYINGEYNCGGVHFTQEILEQFSSKYEFIGINTSEQIVDNLKYIRSHLPEDCILAVMLGGELRYEKNIFPAYENRHLVHREINNAIRSVAKELDIHLIDVNKYLVDQNSFYDHFNHYIKPVYYALAGEIVTLINEKTGEQIRETSKLKMLQVRMKEMMAPLYYSVRRIIRF